MLAACAGLGPSGSWLHWLLAAACLQSQKHRVHQKKGRNKLRKVETRRLRCACGAVRNVQLGAGCATQMHACAGQHKLGKTWYMLHMLLAAHFARLTCPCRQHPADLHTSSSAITAAIWRTICCICLLLWLHTRCSGYRCQWLPHAACCCFQ